MELVIGYRRRRLVVAGQLLSVCLAPRRRAGAMASVGRRPGRATSSVPHRLVVHVTRLAWCLILARFYVAQAALNSRSLSNGQTLRTLYVGSRLPRLLAGGKRHSLSAGMGACAVSGGGESW